MASPITPAAGVSARTATRPPPAAFAFAVALAMAAAGYTAVTAFGPRDTAVAAGPAKQLENLDRGLLSVRSGTGNLVSWRLLGTDPGNIGFNVYRGSTRLTTAPVTDST